MPDGENFITASGVILSRRQSGENALWLILFLKEYGIMNVTAPAFSSIRKNFGGDTEPFLWGVFSLRKKNKGRSYFIDDIEITDDMMSLRKSRTTIMTAFKWSKAVMKYLMPEQPDDDLLSNLYWNMKLLCDKRIPAYVSDWRFIWLWLEEWGLAPDIASFHASMNFNRDEIFLLVQVAKLGINEIVKLFSEGLKPNVRENVFKVAVKLALNFLNEK